MTHPSFSDAEIVHLKAFEGSVLPLDSPNVAERASEALNKRMARMSGLAS